MSSRVHPVRPGAASYHTLLDMHEFLNVVEFPGVESLLISFLGYNYYVSCLFAFKNITYVRLFF